MEDQESPDSDLEDSDLADFVEEDGTDEGLEGEDFVLPVQISTDDDVSSTPSGNQIPSYIGLKVDSDGSHVDAFHKFIKPFLYPRDDGTLGDANYKKWNNPIECILALRHLKPGGGFKDAHDTTGTFTIFHYYIRGATLYEGIRKVKTGEFKGTVYE